MASLWSAGSWKLQLTLGGPANTKYLSSQLLSTADGGAASLLSVLCTSASPHTPSSSTGKAAAYAQVYLVDVRAALDIAAKSVSGRARCVTVSPLCEVPFNATAEASTPGLSPASLFSFGRTAIQAGGDSIVRGEIDPASVRAYARRVWDRDTVVPGAGLSDAAAEAALAGAVRNVSFAVRLQSLQGAEVAGACRCTGQKVIDRFSQVGCEIFSRPCSTTLPGGLHTEIAVSTFRADGTALTAEPSLTPLFSVTAETDPLPLWKAALSLDLISPSRKAQFESLLHDLDQSSAETASADDSSRYFVPARMVLLETALGAGVGHLVASYVLCRSEDAASQPSGFLLADVRRFHDWAFAAPAAGASLPGLHIALEQATQNLCRDHLAQALLSADASSSPRAGWLGQILHLRALAAGLGQVTEALLERKLAALEDSASAEDAVLQSVIEEGQVALRVHIHELKCLVRVLSLLYEIGKAQDLTFRSLLTGELHSRQSSGRVQSSSSSAAAAAAMLSQYEVVRLARAESAASGEQAGYLPKYLRTAADGSTLFDSLCRLLGPSSLKSTAFLRTDSQSALGVNLSALCKAVAEFLLLPLTALKEAAAVSIGAGQRGVGIGGASSTSSPEDLDASLSNATNVAFSVVLFFLAEMRHLSSGPAADSEKLQLEATQRLVRSAGIAADVPLTVRNGVLALWQVEADAGVSQAVRVICSADATVQHDQDILVAVIKRMLSSQRLKECQALLQYLQRSSNALAGTRFFVMATAAAIPRPDSWKFCWHAAKELAASLHPLQASAEAVLLRREIMQLCVRWALCHDEMPGVLTAALDKEEGEEVEVVLRSLAGRDVDRAVFPSAAVDTCVAILLRGAKFDDAITVHEQHAFAVSAHVSPASAEWPTIQFQLASRRELIVAHASIPTIPVECFRG